jgi:hypothetical protein
MSPPVVFFHTIGYIRMPGLVDPEVCDQLRAVAYRIAEQSNHRHVTNRSERTRIDHVVTMDSAYLAVARSDRLISTLAPIIGPDIELLENRHNHISIYRAAATDRLHRDVLQ